MEHGATLPVSIALIVSYALSVWATRKRRSPKVEDYLFEGNRPNLALASSVGSIFSMSIAGTALVAAGFLFGSQIILPLTIGAALGTVVLIRLTGTQPGRHFTQLPVTRRYFAGISYPVFLSREGGAGYVLLLAPLLMVVYVGMLTMELTVLRVVLEALLPFPRAEILLLVAIMVGMAYCYTFVGGYRGVLLTDHFQILTILVLLWTALSDADLAAFAKSLPHPFTAKVHWNTVSSVLLLHASVTAGSFFFATASVDHWNRTIGSLPRKEAISVLVKAAILASLGSSLLVLVGSYAHTLDHMPPTIGSEVPLELAHRFLDSSTPTTRFSFFLALTCIMLTTLDTYIITLQQLYYEFSIRLKTKSHRTYLWQWMLKWKQIRVVGAVLTLFSYFLSSALPGDAVYSFGVVTLSAFSLICFPIIRAALPGMPVLRELHGVRALILTLALNIAGFPLALWVANVYLGPLRLHLYLICGAALAAAVGAILLARMLVLLAPSTFLGTAK